MNQLRIWTIQTIARWTSLIRSNSDSAYRVTCDEGTFLPDSYQWLKANLTSRLGWQKGRELWWAYCEKPDLRTYRHDLQRDIHYVRVELDIPRENLFVMPSWAWDTVYRQDYLAFSEAEYYQWTGSMLDCVPLDPVFTSMRVPVWPLPEPWRSELQCSWSRLFSSRLPRESWTDRWSDKREAVFDELRLEYVVAVEAIRPNTSVSSPAR